MFRFASKSHLLLITSKHRGAVFLFPSHRTRPLRLYFHRERDVKEKKEGERKKEASFKCRRSGGHAEMNEVGSSQTGSTVQVLLISLIRTRRSLRPHETVCGSLSTSETDGARPYKYRGEAYRACISRSFPRGYSLFLSILVFLESKRYAHIQAARGYSQLRLPPPPPREASATDDYPPTVCQVIGTTVPDLGMDKVGKKVPLSTRETH